MSKASDATKLEALQHELLMTAGLYAADFPEVQEKLRHAADVLADAACMLRYEVGMGGTDKQGRKPSRRHSHTETVHDAWTGMYEAAQAKYREEHVCDPKPFGDELGSEFCPECGQVFSLVDYDDWSETQELQWS